MTRFRLVLGGVLSVVGLSALLSWMLSRGGVGSEPPAEALAQFAETPELPFDETLLWGERNQDLYPSVDSPRYVGPAEADEFLADGDEVFTFVLGQSTFVYPKVLLASYHAVNDVIGGEPFTITYCLLAGSACSFSRRLGDRVLTFGLTGQLYSGNNVLYDKETGTEWLQLNGEPLRGPYRGKARLEHLALSSTTWRRIRGRSQVKVLAPIDEMKEYREFARDMEQGTLGQDSVEAQTTIDDRLDPYTKGLGVAVHGQARFYPRAQPGTHRAFQDTVGGWAVLIVQDEDGGPSGPLRRYHDGRVLDFELRDDELYDLQTDSRWTLDGQCVEGALRGERLEVPSHAHVYWFAWSTLYPSTGILGA